MEGGGGTNRFEHVGKDSGCFVTGAKPFWVVLYHGHVRVHPMLLDAATAFTSFHNVNCKRGFIYSTVGKVNAKSLMQVGARAVARLVRSVLWVPSTTSSRRGPHAVSAVPVCPLPPLGSRRGRLFRVRRWRRRCRAG